MLATLAASLSAATCAKMPSMSNAGIHRLRTQSLVHSLSTTDLDNSDNDHSDDDDDVDITNEVDGTQDRGLISPESPAFMKAFSFTLDNKNPKMFGLVPTVRDNYTGYNVDEEMNYEPIRESVTV